MKLQPFVDRLAGCGFVTLGGILEWAALRQAPGRIPAGYIVPMDETAGDNRNDTGVDQRVVNEIMLAMVLQAGARSAATVNDQLEELCDAAKQQLVGWTHPQASGPLLYAGGRLLSADGSTLSWGLRFRNSYHLRNIR